MVSELVIKKAEFRDAVVLEKISVETFRETFAAQNTKEDMDLFFKECFNLDAIKKELSDADITYYMAFLGEELTGYVKVRENSHPDLTSKNSLEIARIYVYEKYHGKKAGAALIKFVIDLALKNKFDVLWLGVWEHNPKAIEFYRRWGFELFGSHIFRLGTDDQNDLLMCKYLVKE